MNKKLLFSLLCLSIGLSPLYATTDTLTHRRDIDEIVVIGARHERDNCLSASTVTVVGRETIEKSHQSSLLPILSTQVPGLFVTGRGLLGYGVSTGAAGSMSLRGIGNAPTTGLLVLIDGHPQYMGLMGHPIADAYQSASTESVEVVRGPASVLYGSNAMGGVINITTRQATSNGNHTHVRAGYGSFNTLTSEISNRTRINRFGSMVSAYYNRTDGHRRDMGFEQMGGTVRLSYDLATAWKIAADTHITHFNASNPGEVTAPRFDNDSHITRYTTSLSVENRYKNTAGAITAFYNHGRHRIDDGYLQGGTPPDYRFNSRDFMTGVSVYQSTTFFRGNRLTLGADYQHFGGKAWNHNLTTDTNPVLVDKCIDNIAGYADLRQDIGHALTLNAGIRFDHNTHSGSAWIPQGGISAHLPRNIELKALASKGFRNPTIREMYMFPPQNPDLKPESVMNYEVSFSQEIPQHNLTYGLNLYYLHGKNLIQAVRVSNGVRNMNTGKVDNCGIEAEINWRISPPWRITAHYCYLHTSRPLLAAPEHKAVASVYYHAGRWSASTDVQYVHGLYTSLDSPTRENFVLWNARIDYRICQIFTIFVSGENLLAQRYEINKGYPMPKATCMGGIDVQF